MDIINDELYECMAKNVRCNIVHVECCYNCKHVKGGNLCYQSGKKELTSPDSVCKFHKGWLSD
ncbi:MAG: hypothetical protein ACRCU6_09100 [Fusobacteriaceae bacterium]